VRCRILRLRDSGSVLEAGKFAGNCRGSSDGLHFNPGDAEDLASKVEWAWSHPLELTEMGHAARAKYELYYTAEKNYSLLMGIYDQALGACGSPGLAAARRPGDVQLESN
jgi:glycosyltransferase involved in cell wall biosynthesis